MRTIFSLLVISTENVEAIWRKSVHCRKHFLVICPIITRVGNKFNDFEVVIKLAEINVF